MNTLPLIIWSLWVLGVGACVGSFLNVCALRLPLEKSVLWPGSRCSLCLQPIALRDNLPLISYWMLRGRCRSCGAKFSLRYFGMELAVSLLFLALFYAIVVANVMHQPFVANNGWQIRAGAIPFAVWMLWLQTMLLTSFLLVAALCDIQSREIPLSITITGTLVGLLFSTLFPWPYPHGGLPPGIAPFVDGPWWMLPEPLPRGIQPWPAWGPLLAAGSHLSGLFTGIVGMLAGTFMLRAVRFLFSRGLGREALGLGDADLMMMVGAFWGWQVVVVAFFMGALVALVFAILQLAITRDTSLPFGPGLSVGSILTCLLWWHIGPVLQPIFFNGFLVAFVAVAGAAFMLISALAIRFVRGVPADAGELK